MINHVGSLVLKIEFYKINIEYVLFFLFWEIIVNGFICQKGLTVNKHCPWDKDEADKELYKKHRIAKKMIVLSDIYDKLLSVKTFYKKYCSKQRQNYNKDDI